jgi:hypothetical protein
VICLTTCSFYTHYTGEVPKWSQRGRLESGLGAKHSHAGSNPALSASLNLNKIKVLIVSRIPACFLCDIRCTVIAEIWPSGCPFSVLTIYRRHLKSCPHTSATYRRCKCPIHVRGTLNRKMIKRQSLDLTRSRHFEPEDDQATVAGSYELGEGPRES